MSLREGKITSMLMEKAPAYVNEIMNLCITVKYRRYIVSLAKLYYQITTL